MIKNPKAWTCRKLWLSRGYKYPCFPASCIISGNIICYCLLLHLVYGTVFYETAIYSNYIGSKEFFFIRLITLISVHIHDAYICVYIHIYTIYTKRSPGKASVRKWGFCNAGGEQVRYVVVDTCLKSLLQKQRMCFLLWSILFSLANLWELHRNTKIHHLINSMIIPFYSYRFWYK